MIICYEGTPGSGKSLDAVVKIIDNLRLGRTVYTNISGIDDPVAREYIKLKAKLDDYEISTCLVYLSDLEITQPQKHCKQGSLIVIDEVHKRLNARDWQTPKNKEFADWGSTHRHGGYDVVLITQGLEKVDSQIRGLVEFTHRYKKNNYFGSLLESKYLVKVYEEDSTKIIGRRSGTYDKSIFKCYKSYVAGDIKEMKIQANVNILKHPIFYALPVMLLVTLYMFSKSSFASGDLFGTKARLEPKKTEKSLNNGKVVVHEERVYDTIVAKKPVVPVKRPVPKVSPGVVFSSSVPVNPVNISGPRGGPRSFVRSESTDPLNRQGLMFPGGVPGSVQGLPNVIEKPVVQTVVKVTFGCSGDECYTVRNGEVVAVNVQ